MITIIGPTTAKCDVCGTVIRALRAEQLFDLARRHTAESHRTPATTPPWPVGGSPTG